MYINLSNLSVLQCQELILLLESLVQIWPKIHFCHFLWAEFGKLCMLLLSVENTFRSLVELASILKNPFSWFLRLPRAS